MSVFSCRSRMASQSSVTFNFITLRYIISSAPYYIILFNVRLYWNGVTITIHTAPMSKSCSASCRIRDVASALAVRVMSGEPRRGQTSIHGCPSRGIFCRIGRG